MFGDAGVVGRRGWASERMAGSRGKARYEESLRKHKVKYKLTYERKSINSLITHAYLTQSTGFAASRESLIELTIF